MPRPLLLTVNEAAELIGLGRTTIYKLMDAGDLASVHVGKSRRVPLDEVYDFIDRVCGRSDRGGRGRMSE
jgi:excisionase family DNA binding protein